MRIWKIMVLVVVLAFVGIVLARQMVARSIVQSVLAENFDGEVDIETIDVDLWRSTVLLDGIHVRNPAEFPGDTALEVDRLHITYRFFSLFTRTVQLPSVTLHVKRVVMVTNEQGQNNFERLARRNNPRVAPAGESLPVPGDDPSGAGTVSDSAVPTNERERAQDKSAAKSRRNTHIDHLEFRLGEVEMRDYSRGAPEPSVRNYRLNLERTFSDVQDVDAVVQALGMDLAMAMGPQLIRDVMEESNVRAEDIMETITTHDGDLDELGRKLDSQTKDLQRELRRQLRGLREQDDH